MVCSGHPAFRYQGCSGLAPGNVDRHKHFPPLFHKCMCVMQESLLQIVAASTFAIIGAALECHVNEASRRGWTLPSQLAKGMVSTRVFDF